MKICLACNQSFISKSWCCPKCAWEPEDINGFPAFAPEFAFTGSGFKPEAFSQLVALESGSFWFRARNQLILWALGKYFPQSQNFLEIGCGTGFVLSGIAAERPDLQLTGSELFSEGLKFAGTRLPDSVDLMQMNALHIPYLSEFDTVGMFDVLEHIAEDTEVLNQVYKSLNPNGGMLITVPQHQFLWSATDAAAQHVRRYSSLELQEKVKKAGFKVVRLTSFVSFLFPGMLVSRLLQRRKKDDEAQSELALPGSMDSLLEYVMRFEMKMIRAGLNFPFGGSLLLVAQKL